MDKNITAYTNQTVDAIKQLEAMQNVQHTSTRSKAQELYHYHIDRVQDFQHERLVHLLVTFFFAILLILAISGLLWTGSTTIIAGPVLTYLFTAASLVLGITMLFYVRHYYLLENGVQKLYLQTEKLHQLLR